MKARGDGNGKHGMRAQAAPRGASRIAPPPVKKSRQWRMPNINWQLLGKVFTLLLAVVAVGGGFELWQVLEPRFNRTVTHVRVEGKLGEVAARNQLELQQQLESFGEVKILTADIGAMQRRLEQLAWVDQARISRIWPNQLQIEVVEQQPIARWSEGQWLNSRGQVFSGVTREPGTGLPELLGPTGTEAKVMQQYWNLTRILRPLGFNVERLELRERGSWFVNTREGLNLLLGRDDIGEKMRRFVAIYEQELKEQMEQVASVDLRYANGLAVAWRPVAAESAVVQ